MTDQPDDLDAVRGRLEVAYRIRTVRIAVYSTYMAVAAILAYPLVPGHASGFGAPLLGLAAGAVIAASLFGFALRWPAIFAAGWGERVMFTWSALDVVLVTLLCALTGGPTSMGTLFFVLTTIFFAASYPLAGQVCLFALTIVCYLGLAAAWPHPVPGAWVFAVSAVVGMTWFMAAFLARERDHEMLKHLSALALAEHRAELLGAVARTVSDITTFDAELAMAGVSESLVGLGFESAGFMSLEDSGRRLGFRHARGSVESLDLEAALGSSGLIGMVRDRNGTVLVEDHSNHPAAYPPALRGLGFKAVIAAPVRVGGELRAVLVAGLTRAVLLARTDVEVVEVLAAQIGGSLENAGRFQREQAVASQALEASRRDELTGIGNRRHANALLLGVRPNDAVVLLDLDHFKSVNDQFGHPVGDRLLVDLATHLRAQLRDADDIARYGGEEFMIILRSVGTDALGAAERLLESWRRTRPSASFSGGVAVHTGDSPVELTVKRADAALYAAKVLGRDRVCVFGPDLDLKSPSFEG